MQLTLREESKAALLSAFPAAYANVLGDRVLIRPCMTAANEAVKLRALAVVDDGTSQSLLLVSQSALWEGKAAIPPGGVGYPVLPVSIADEDPKPPAPREVLPGPNGEGKPFVEKPKPAPAETTKEEDPPSLTVWELMEEPWRQLESSGVLRISRDADAMPTAVTLASGGVEWSGVLPAAGGGEGKPVRVRLIGPEFSEGLSLTGRTAAPECGFCRFMKNGPCGDEFVAWEACIDAARDDGKDFVEVCGKPTMRLKGCTDAHPEYYGDVAGEKDEKE